MSVLDSFDKWREFLGEHVDKAQAMGFSDEQISNVAKKMGEFLADKVDPKNDEQRLLKEMWDSANEQERNAIASVMVKMADKAH
ncbi:uncharacterized protein DUF3243 [Alicyclobacillus sacchari]|uniref:DUF3243 domain-containing protein n=2 Tax=Alicyclobacillus TaxID=29330 RepID=A0A1H2QVC6_9BACL|nr:MULTISPECIES: DUF3243 domain-containing protein [Alicyclobacillus]KRW92978.1 hypothetical protein SD51_01590 [Alicyclobacillus tengchongensis]EJY55496.1 hypothetical protein URH17368_1879 [Alicyclobacillus hesperidum URH17-3-68]TDY51312.1 uncharacterized protein DUF3243 [Alicyclobacillus sacchari]SDW11103.1 Protein of unknown function [Alicyclobacillus hesperidum]GLG00382.1 hypothetical protein Alches_04210 [Alicyclobacillus hesperidum subsp. aegles]